MSAKASSPPNYRPAQHRPASAWMGVALPRKTAGSGVAVERKTSAVTFGIRHLRHLCDRLLATTVVSNDAVVLQIPIAA